MFYPVNRNLGQETVQGRRYAYVTPIDQDDNNESLVAMQPGDSKINHKQKYLFEMVENIAEEKGENAGDQRLFHWFVVLRFNATYSGWLYWGLMSLTAMI